MASKANGFDGSEWARGPPSSQTGWQSFKKAIYDPDEGSFLGRTPKRWGIAIIFYLVFYAVLAVMFTICMTGLSYQLDKTKPYFTLQESLIGANPGVDFRPRSADGYAVQFDVANSTALDTYYSELEQFLKPYQNEKWFNTKKECNAEDNYGFPNSPCFYIKLNKIYGWKPEYFDAEDLPSDMSGDLAEFISRLPVLERQQIWVSCWEENSNATQLEYPWGRGLPSIFYPYLNEHGYRSPLVAVKVTPPVNTPVVLRCRAWAKNIVYNKSIKEATGYARIFLQVEDHTQASVASE